MPKRPRKPKPEDPNVAAFRIVRLVADDEPEPQADGDPGLKLPHVIPQSEAQTQKKGPAKPA
jgi:hypothetical protein